MWIFRRPAFQAERTACAKTRRLEQREQEEDSSRKEIEVMRSRPGRAWWEAGRTLAFLGGEMVPFINFEQKSSIIFCFL